MASLIAAAALLEAAALGQVTVAPSAATANPSGTVAIEATLSPGASSAVTWTLNPAVGTLTTAGTSAVYTAPSIIGSPQTITVTASSVGNTNMTASTLISLVPLITLTVTPSSATVDPSTTQQFQALVTGTGNTGVTWSLDQAVGSISSSGLYTAPPSVTAQQTVNLIAQSVTNPSVVVKQPITVRQGVRFTISQSGLTGLSYNGQSFHSGAEQAVQGAVFTSASGPWIDAGWNSPTTAVQENSMSFQQVYNGAGPNKFTINVVWSTPDYRTLKAVATVTNNDPVNTLEQINLHLISLTLPGPAKISVPVGQPLEVNQYYGNPVTMLSGSWGSVASWLSGYPTSFDLISYYNAASQTAFENFISGYTTVGPNTYRASILPGQTTTITQYVRFGSASDTAISLAPEPYTEYRTAFPDLVDWPDRRPIAQWFISDATSGRSKTNPRGYFWDKTVNAANSAAFQTRALAQTDSTLAIINTVSPKPQGVIIWDLEGQEFNQPFTYVGYPNYLSTIAPEMDGVADQIVAKIKAAGYKIGMTLRPSSFGAGPDLPATCSASSVYDYTDKFIDTSASYPYRGYICTSTGWAVAGQNMPTAQVVSQSYSQIVNTLSQKIQYAQQRWGASIFYIDSTVWEGGTPLDPSIFRTLAAAFPHCLFIPEEYGTYHFGATTPYEAASAGIYGTSQATRNVYPNAFGVINMANGNWSQHMSQLQQAVASGDILMFEGWWWAPEIPAVQQIYAAASTSGN